METVRTFNVGLRMRMLYEAIKFAATFRDDVKLLNEAFRHLNS